MSRVFTVPLNGQGNQRISQTAAGSVFGLAIFGVSKFGSSTPSEAKDERLINCLLTKNGPKNEILKRPGFPALNTPSAGNIGNAVLVWAGNAQKVISAFGATNSTIYDGTTSLGAITGVCSGITETKISDVPTLCITSADNTAWTTTSTGISGALTFTGDTHTNTTVDSISSTSGLVVGQLLTGTGFAANTRIASIDSATAITTTLATTATNAGVTITRTILGKIVDADFPGNAGFTLAGTFAHMKGFASIMTTDGKLWTSDTNTVTAWTATSFISADAYPDSGVGAIAHKGERILAFNTQSMEPFYNAGNPSGSPFSKITPSIQQVGAISNDAITQIADTVFLAGTTPQGGISIFQYDGNMQRISVPEIDFQLVFSGTSGISLTSLRVYGRSLVIVVTTGSTYVYVMEDKRWHEWNGTTVLWYKCAGLSVGSVILTYAVSKVSTSGKVYVINPAALVFQDDSVAWTATIQSARDDQGTGNTKFWEQLRVICDREPVASNLTIEASDDDYQSFTTLGTVDLSLPDPKLTALGASNARAWRLTHSANTPFRIERLEGQMSVGSI